MRYLEYELTKMKALLKTRPRLNENVLLPLGMNVKATDKDIYRLIEELKREYKPFSTSDDDFAMRGMVINAVNSLIYQANQIMSDRTRDYFYRTVDLANEITDTTSDDDCQRFSIVVRNLLIIYSNYDRNRNYIDLWTSTIRYGAISELCGSQISLIYKREELSYQCDMYNPQTLVEWTISNSLPVHYTNKGKENVIKFADCNLAQFLYCTVLIGLNTMLEGSRNG